ncbi:MAG: hypothetical protein HOP19_08950 [Acidobacteria bacterium]|nr:hypothetical protein [Acidobacteriota bacterium]
MSNNTSEQIQPITGAIAAPTKFVIQAEYQGFPVVVECTGKADILKSTIDRLMSIGATPPAQRTTTASAATAGDSSAPPKCRIHHVPMKPSRKPGNFFCPKKDGQHYCAETVKV